MEKLHSYTNEVSLVYNDVDQGIKVLSTVENQLKDCEEFLISVAFITQSGVKCLLETLKELEKKNIKGKILTSDYLTFSEPNALKKINSFTNLELKIYKCINNQGFHTKGYIFKHNSFDIIIVGSSNLTSNALSINKEWNTKVVIDSNDKYNNDIYIEFDSMWNIAKDYNDYIDEYTNKYKIKKSSTITYNDNITINRVIEPNQMQLDFINNFSMSYKKHDKAGLLVSATGSGKTYASAFAIKHLKFNKVLFVAHRTKLLLQAINSYNVVFKDNFDYGLLDGEHKELNHRFIFANISTLGKKEIYSMLDKDNFDLIIYDEVHRAGSNLYQAITNYFNPKYLLGMSATPTRTDDFDIYKMFGYNILHEITLQTALKYNLLCPFHYYGVTDLIINNESIKDKTTFNILTSDSRVKHIIETIEYYSFEDIKTKGLIFCSNIEEANELSNKFNEYNYKTISLNSKNIKKQEDIDNAIKLLESDDNINYLDYIFTVDIFNEGVDIPQVNQIIMLRPTKSPIVFVQQLGRGLRKYKDKYYVTIIDFIGNYNNNFMIPIALSNDYSYNKDNLRRFINNPNTILSGESTIHFDIISKNKIYETINSNNFNNLKIIKEAYFNVKNKLGKIPTLLEFVKYSNYDISLIFENDKLLSYYGLLNKMEKDIIKLEPMQEYYLAYISSRVCDGKRLHEIIFLEYIIKNKSITYNELNNLFDSYNLNYNKNTIITIINVLNSEFIKGTSRYSKNKVILIEDKKDHIIISNEFNELLNIELNKYIQELIIYSKSKYNNNYSNTYNDTNLVLYKKYTYEDVCRLLSMHRSYSSTMFGYFHEKITNTFTIFINYHKDSNINDSIKYEDKFISNNEILAISKQNKKIDSREIKLIYNKLDIHPIKHLFVKKSSNESKEFYYLGQVNTIGEPTQTSRNNKPEVIIKYKLDNKVPDELYNYITNSSIEEKE